MKNIKELGDNFFCKELRLEWEWVVANVVYDTPFEMLDMLRLIMGRNYYKTCGLPALGFTSLDDQGWRGGASKQHKKALRAIKVGDLHVCAYAQPRVRSGVWDKDEDMIYHCTKNPPHYQQVDNFRFFFGDLLIWAIRARVPICEEALRALCAVVQKNFNPIHTQLQSAAQVIWDKYPETTIKALESHSIILDLLKEEGYNREDTLRDIVNKVDPRTKNQKQKPTKIKNYNSLIYNPPKEIPGVFREDGKVDVLRLMTVCQTVIQTLKKLGDNDFFISGSHPFIDLYLKKAPLLIQKSVTLWLKRLFKISQQLPQLNSLDFFAKNKCPHGELAFKSLIIDLAADWGKLF